MGRAERGSSEPFLHPVIVGLVLLIGAVGVVRHYATVRDRRAAVAATSSRPLVREARPAASSAEEEEGDDADAPLELEEVPSSFDAWYLDYETDSRQCAFDFDPDRSLRLSIHQQRLANGLRLLMSPQDVAFLAWTAFTYRLNPHFLLGVMMAESGGDCSAVSSAGAQGCFQLTYRQGAGQLKNSYPERVASWYWAPRSNVGDGAHRRPEEALGYWPADLYVPPSRYFRTAVKPGVRQLRMTLDPVATLMTSDRQGDTQVSSVANFSFGVIGAGLYFHFLNYYLYSHEAQLKGDVFDLVSVPRLKATWMAASYNQGAPRTMRQLGNYGAKRFPGQLSDDVMSYADTVTDYCEQFQSGSGTYGGQMTFGEFSDFLQQLRWTYSEVPIDWETLQDQLKNRFFRAGRTIDLEADLLSIFYTMRAFEPRLGPETPRVDHHVRF